MSEEMKPFPLLSVQTIAAMPERTHDHAFNPNGSRRTKSLGDACGLTELGVHLVRVLPGRESTEYHTHHHDEEWIYVLSGRGTAQIGERECVVGAGDFMGFVAGSLPHGLVNDGDEDLVYLVGGTRHAWDVVDYPRRGIRSFKYPGRRDDAEVGRLGVPKMR